MVIDTLDYYSNNMANELLQWDDSTSTVKGKLTITRRSDSTYQTFNVTSCTKAIAPDTYFLLDVSRVGGTGNFTAADDLLLNFFPTGDKGDTGATGPAGGGACLKYAAATSTSKVSTSTPMTPSTSLPTNTQARN